MASPWINTFETRPATGQICWIRVPYYYGAPVQAKFFIGTTSYPTRWGFQVNSSVNGFIPFYMVPRWKPYP